MASLPGQKVFVASLMRRTHVYRFRRWSWVCGRPRAWAASFKAAGRWGLKLSKIIFLQDLGQEAWDDDLEENKMLFPRSQMPLLPAAPPSSLLDKDMALPVIGMNFSSSAEESHLLIIPHCTQQPGCFCTLIFWNYVYMIWYTILILLRIFLQRVLIAVPRI